MKEIIKRVFSEIHTQIYGFEYSNYNDSVEICLDNFVKKIPREANELWLRQFIIFQFYTHKDRSGLFKFSWIFGNPALSRWKHRKDSDLYYAEIWKRDNNIYKQFTPLPGKSYYEKERGRFEGERKFIHCLELSLFSEEDCVGCEFYNLCKNENGDL